MSIPIAAVLGRLILGEEVFGYPVVAIGAFLGARALAGTAPLSTDSGGRAVTERPPPQGKENAIAAAFMGISGLWALAKFAVGLFFIIVVGGGLIMGRSESFKMECVAHKAFGFDMGAVKNVICDLNFTISSE